MGVGFAVPVNFVIPLLRAAMNDTADIQRVWDGVTPANCEYTYISKFISMLFFVFFFVLFSNKQHTKTKQINAFLILKEMKVK